MTHYLRADLQDTGESASEIDYLGSMGFPPAFWKHHRPHNNRRAHFHNYKVPGIYMITIPKSPEAPIFSTIAGISPAAPGQLSRPYNGVFINLTQVGSIIESEILEVNSQAEFELGPWVIMPDHVHIIWRVKEWLAKDVGFYIGQLKSRCTKIWRGMMGINGEMEGLVDKLTLFGSGFNDRIGFDSGMVRRLCGYVEDNPRRRLLAILRPELFSRRQRVRILEREFEIFGNFHLLKEPTIAPAIVSSRYTPDELSHHQRLIYEAMRTGGVLISPFISPAERSLLKEGLEAGCKIIRIVPDGMGPRYKPYGLEFDLCSEGRLLHLGLPRPSAHKEELRREACLRMNALARWIASHPAETMVLINEARE